MSHLSHHLFLICFIGWRLQMCWWATAETWACISQGPHPLLRARWISLSLSFASSSWALGRATLPHCKSTRTHLPLVRTCPWGPESELRLNLKSLCCLQKRAVVLRHSCFCAFRLVLAGKMSCCILAFTTKPVASAWLTSVLRNSHLPMSQMAYETRTTNPDCSLPAHHMSLPPLQPQHSLPF